MIDNLYSIDELEGQLGPAQRRETVGGILRRGQPAHLPAAELVSGRVLTWSCGCRASAGDSCADGTLFYTLEPCRRHRQLQSGIIHPCLVLAELSGLSGKGLQLSSSPSAESCRRVLTHAIELGVANIAPVFAQGFDELGGSSLNELLASGEIERAADGLDRILENHPALLIVRIQE